MKTVRTVNGVSRIEDAMEGSSKLNDVLVPILIAHRDTLVKRILDHLEVYLDYKFHIKPTREKMNHVRDKLASLKGNGIDEAKYTSLFMEINTKDRLYVGTSKFYEEIDHTIEWSLK
ncbi:MAG TPA: hypothetical protein VFW11_22015 [Cyclobacteriaceae bacterium]|nr:hypothetical protein [Cyclobacteriaceae bacterium]